MKRSTYYLNVDSSFSEEPTVDIQEINLSGAKRLDSQNQIYDTFSLTCNHHRLFIKRLKENLREKPFYRSALTKEFEIGARLRHKGLPTYRLLGEDYVAMDFINGRTITQMVEDNDQWLYQPSNLRRLLLQLLEIVSYLHSHNVRHCDIKPDNIMITEAGHNVILLDLDKCHADWLHETSGDPAIYLVEKDKTGSEEIDFHGIGLLIDFLIANIPISDIRLFRRVRNLCFSNNADIESIYNSLNKPKRPILLLLSIVVGIMILAIVIIVSLWTRSESDPDMPSQPSAEEHREDIQFPEKDNEITPNSYNSEIINAPVTTPVEIKTEEHPRETNEPELTNKIDSKIAEHFAELAPYFLTIQTIDESGVKITDEQINQYETKIKRLFENIRSEVKDDLRRDEPTLSDQSIENVLTQSPSYQRFYQETQKALEILDNLKHKND